LAHQIVMRTGCNHAALIQDKNAVCFLDGRQTMGHNQGRTVAGQKGLKGGGVARSYDPLAGLWRRRVTAVLDK